MDYDSNLVRFLILAPILPGAITLFVLFRRKVQKDIRWFVAYLLLVVSGGLILFLIYQSHKEWNFFYAGQVYDGIAAVIGFLVIHDIFRNAIGEYEAIRRTGTLFLAIVGLALFVVALFVGFYAPTNAYPEVKAILTTERSVRVIQVGLIVAIFALSSFLGLSWRHHVFGIALGFGLYAALNLSTIALVAHSGSRVAFKVWIIDQSAFDCTVVLWMMYALQSQDRPLANIPPSSRQDLEHWNQSLSELLTR